MRLQNTFLTNLSKEMDMYMSLIILTQNGSYNFHAIILFCLKATVDSKLFTLHCTEMMAWQRSSDNSLTDSFVQ